MKYLLPLLLLISVNASAQDTIPPVLELVGDSIVCIAMNSEYTDAGYTVSDNLAPEKELTISEGGDYLDTKRQGRFCLYYQAEDSSGNMGDKVYRTICVGLEKDACRALKGKWCGTVTSLNERTSLQLRVYPNPSTGQIQIETGRSIDYTNVYTLEGMLLLSKQPNTNMTTLHLTGSGVYVLEVGMGHEITRKLITVQ